MKWFAICMCMIYRNFSCEEVVLKLCKGKTGALSMLDLHCLKDRFDLGSGAENQLSFSHTILQLKSEE